jgi:hypothetical protein
MPRRLEAKAWSGKPVRSACARSAAGTLTSPKLTE